MSRNTQNLTLKKAIQMLDGLFWSVDEDPKETAKYLRKAPIYRPLFEQIGRIEGSRRKHQKNAVQEYTDDNWPATLSAESRSRDLLLTLCQTYIDLLTLIEDTLWGMATLYESDQAYDTYALCVVLLRLKMSVLKEMKNHIDAESNVGSLSNAFMCDLRHYKKMVAQKRAVYLEETANLMMDTKLNKTVPVPRTHLKFLDKLFPIKKTHAVDRWYRPGQFDALETGEQKKETIRYSSL